MAAVARRPRSSSRVLEIEDEKEAASRSDGVLRLDVDVIRRRRLADCRLGSQLLVELADGSPAAVKLVSLATLCRQQAIDSLLREARLAKRMRHPWLLPLKGIVRSSTTVGLLYDYLPGGDLFTRLSKAGRFDLNTTRFYAAQLLQVLDALHQSGLVYRDLKLEHVVLDADGYAKLTDLRFTKHLEPGTRTFTLCGSMDFVPPETLAGKGASFEADWWALGIVIFEMMAGYPPFHHSSPVKAMQLILHSEPDFPDYVPDTARAFVRLLLHKRPEKRCGAEEARLHRFFSSLDFRALVARSLKAPLRVRAAEPFDAPYAAITESMLEAETEEAMKAADGGAEAIAAAAASTAAVGTSIAMESIDMELPEPEAAKLAKLEALFG